MANRRPLIDATVELDGYESVNSVDSVANDFAALVAILEQQLELVSPSDHETRTHITQAKAAAERGAQLSRALVDRIESKN
jgi:signal transduction histidine kinase